jgi:cytochrome c556
MKRLFVVAAALLCVASAVYAQPDLDVLREKVMRAGPTLRVKMRELVLQRYPDLPQKVVAFAAEKYPKLPPKRSRHSPHRSSKTSTRAMHAS